MCGVIGIIGDSNDNTPAKDVYLGLAMLQHRGQDSAGILSYDDHQHAFNLHKKKGLIAEVFSERDLVKLQGRVSIGHTRYQTTGSDASEEVQPMLLNYPYGIGMVHNGNVVNYHNLANKLRQENNRHTFSKSDLEVILNIFARELEASKAATLFEKLCETTNVILGSVKGGYATIGMIAGKGLFAFRDPKGIRPLILGHREGSYCLASESAALEFLGYEVIRDISPGELLFIEDKTLILHSKILMKDPPRPCMFEWVYFANPQSILDGSPVYQVRHTLGQKLGLKVKRLMKELNFTPDIIAPVPETSRIASIALSEELGIPIREILIKNRYVQRSFILNSQRQRKNAVEMKLSPVRSEIEGKKILLLDDSIVRGTTSIRIVELLKQSGASEVYFASSCPPIRHPCFFGIDFPDQEELIAFNKSEKEVSEAIGADRVIYLDEKDLIQALGVSSACLSCLNGDYPIDISEAADFKKKRRQARIENEL